MHLKLLGVSLAITIIIGGLAVVAFSISSPAQNIGEQEVVIPQTPRFPELWEVHLDSISLSDARERAGFA